jgi:hypothetical protein
MTGNGKKWHLPSVTMGVPIHWETEFRHAIFWAERRVQKPLTWIVCDAD